MEMKFNITSTFLLLLVVVEVVSAADFDVTKFGAKPTGDSDISQVRRNIFVFCQNKSCNYLLSTMFCRWYLILQA